MNRKFDLSKYIEEQTNNYFIVRYKEFTLQEKEDKPYKTIPIIHNSEIKKRVIYLDISFKKLTKSIGESIGNNFIKLFSKRTNEQIKAKKRIIDVYKNKLDIAA